MVEFVPGFDLEVAIAPAADRADPSVAWPWTDVTSSVRWKDGVSIEAGRADEQSEVGPGRCSLVFDNRSGNYTRTNPSGAYYGTLSKNTPIRIRVTPDDDEVTDAFGRTVTSGWGTADTGQSWFAYQNAGSVSDFATTGTTATHSVQSNLSYRISYLPTVQLEDANVSTTVSVAVPTGGVIEPANLLLRGQNPTTYYMCRLVVTQGTNAVTASIMIVVFGIEATLGSAATGLTHAAGTPLNVRAEVVGTTIRMRAWQGGSEPGTWAVSVTDDGITQAGWVGIRSGVGSGNTNVKPVVYTYDNVSVSGPHDLFLGEVPEWAPRWNKSARDRRVPITAAGILRRLNQNAPVLRSPAYQALVGVDPYRLAYWPLEEEGAATTVSSPVGSKPPNILAGTLNFGAYTDSPSSARMLTFGAGAELQFPLDAYSSTEHKVIGLWKVPDAGLPADRRAMRLYCLDGTIGAIDLVITTAGALRLDAFNFSFAVVDQTGNIAFGVNGREVMISIELTQDGADLDTRMFVQYADDGSNLLSDDTFTGLTIGRIAYVRLAVEDLTDVSFGHLAVADSTDLGFYNYIVPSGSTPPGVTGYAGEPAATRVERLCDQAGIPIVVRAADSDIGSEAMGPQLVASVLDNLRDCETADHGVLFENGVGLAYQPRSARYAAVDGGEGAVIALALDVDSRELGEPPEPVDDDAHLLNDVTVNRPNGGQARYEAEGDYAPTGPVGRYDTQVDLNLETDVRLGWHAQWMVGVGTQDDLRWPLVDLQLAANSALALRWLGIMPGSRITVSNPPEGVAPDVLDLIVEGWSCTIGKSVWTVAMNCSPTRPYHVIALEGTANQSRLDTAGSEVAYPVTTSATSIPLATTSGPAWTTTAGDFPHDHNIGGEQVTVSAIATSTPAFGAAGTVAHADNASVSPGLPAGVAVGRLMLLVAAIRNSGTGEPDADALAEDGWLHLAGDNNLQVFYRYNQSGDTAPTVPFTGGVAGATCSARIVDFSGLTHTLAGGAVVEQLNSSSDSIAYGSYEPVFARGVQFIVGWKQNDHTGVTAVSGFTESFDSFTTTGDDQSLFMQHRVYTTPRDLVAGSVTAGGAVSAVNRSLVFGLRALQTATVTRSVNGVVKTHTGGTAVTLWKPYIVGL